MEATTLGRPARISFVVMGVALVLIAFLHLGSLVLAMLFGYFALERFSFGRSKFVAVSLYIVVVLGLITGLGYFSKSAGVALPKIADRSIPAIAEFAERHNLELPFTDYQSLKTVVLAEVKERVAGLGNAARAAVFEIIQVLVGLVAAVSLFLNVRWGHENDPNTSHDSLYSAVLRELSSRGATFFRSFSKVMSAQILISAINTTLTSIFLLWNHFPYTPVLIVTTFLCGLLPIIGNIMSNTLLVGVAFTLSPELALVALIFLVVIHKLEYFLNSKIIGDRIRNPMWLTLMALLLGEKLMGVPGMILAPAVLHYLKIEASKHKISEPQKSDRNT